MARIINAKEVMQLYASAFPEDEMQLEVLDKQLSVNNGYYYLCNGKCMYSTERLPGAHIKMNFCVLSCRVFQSFLPYLSLMLNLNMLLPREVLFVAIQIAHPFAGGQQKSADPKVRSRICIYYLSRYSFLTNRLHIANLPIRL